MKSYQELNEKTSTERLETMTVVDLIKLIRGLEEKNRSYKKIINNYRINEKSNEISFWKKITCHSAILDSGNDSDNEEIIISYPVNKNKG